MIRHLSLFPLLLVLCVDVSVVSAQDETLFPLPNDFGVLKFYSVDESSDYSDSDGSIVLVSGSAMTGRYSVALRSFAWYDAARRRTVPALVFYPSARGQRFPIIVFSHGLGGSPSRCSYLASAWAARGFVVVLLQHPGSDENVWKGKVRILNELREAYKTSWTGRTRALDIRFVLDQLESLEKNGDWLRSLLDFGNIGVGGYDLGSLASLLVVGQLPPDGGSSLADSRVKAVLAMSPPINPPQGSYRNVYAAVDVPAFFITGTDDDGIVGSTKATERRIPFDAMSGNSRYLVVLHGADHQIYGGHFLSFRGRNDQSFQQAISRVSTLFWQAYLKNDEQAINDLTGYRLNSLLGVAATVERRILPRSTAAHSVPEPELSKPSAEKPLPNGSSLLSESFPLTRLYRVMVAKSER